MLQGWAVIGPHAGTQPPFATSFVSEWYGWAAYFPQTTDVRTVGDVTVWRIR